MKDILLLVLGAALLLGAWLAFSVASDQSAEPAVPSVAVEVRDTSESLDEFHEQLFLERVNRSPEWVTQLRLFGSQPDPTGNLLDDISIAYQRQSVTLAKSGLAKLRSFDRASQSDAQRLTTDLLGWYLDDIVRGEDFLLHGYLVDQLFSVPNQLYSFLLDNHLIHTLKDAQDYADRLYAVDDKFEQLIQVLNAQEARGIVAPKFILDRVLQSLSPGPQDPTQHVFFTSFVDKLEGVPDLSEARKRDLKAAAARAIQESVQPAYAKLREVVQHQISIATDDAGVWKLPDGDAYYAYMLRHHTTTDLTPEQVHQLGLAEVNRIQTEMRAFFQELGLNREEPDFGALMRDYWGQYRNLAEMTYPDTPQGNQQVVDDYAAIIQEVEGKLAGLFDAMPQSPVLVRAMPPERAGAPAHYEPPSFDGLRPGIFFANVSPPPYKPGMRTLTYHEAIPGHHFHLALQGESNLPLVQKILIFTAHVEGWALYAEKLMRGLGMYPDVHSKIENRWSELFRAARMVVDTGIHYKRWTRQQALDYFNDTLGTPLSSEIDRYIVWPGQACAYKVGELKILELRQRAVDALGERFDIKAFHNLMLQHGNMPLDILEQQVDRYIEANKA